MSQRSGVPAPAGTAVGGQRRARRPLASGPKAHHDQISKLLAYAGRIVEAHPGVRLFLAEQSAYSQNIHIKSHNMAGACGQLQTAFVEAAAAQGGRAVVAQLSAKLASFGKEGAVVLQAAFGLLEAQGYLGKQLVNTFLKVLADAALDTEGTICGDVLQGVLMAILGCAAAPTTCCITACNRDASVLRTSLHCTDCSCVHAGDARLLKVGHVRKNAGTLVTESGGAGAHSAGQSVEEGNLAAQAAWSVYRAMWMHIRLCAWPLFPMCDTCLPGKHTGPCPPFPRHR